MIRNLSSGRKAQQTQDSLLVALRGSFETMLFRSIMDGLSGAQRKSQSEGAIGYQVVREAGVRVIARCAPIFIEKSSGLFSV
jgi:hypothetical protein